MHCGLRVLVTSISRLGSYQDSSRSSRHSSMPGHFSRRMCRWPLAPTMIKVSIQINTCLLHVCLGSPYLTSAPAFSPCEKQSELQSPCRSVLYCQSPMEADVGLWQQDPSTSRFVSDSILGMTMPESIRGFSKSSEDGSR